MESTRTYFWFELKRILMFQRTFLKQKQLNIIASCMITKVFGCAKEEVIVTRTEHYRLSEELTFSNKLLKDLSCYC